MAQIFSYNDKAAATIPPRAADSHKGTFGRVLVIAGSHGMAGAAFFAAMAAYRTGAGLVEIVSPEENRVILQTLVPEALFSPLSSQESLARAIERADAVVIGPGLGKSRRALEAVQLTLTETHVPLIVDADALNLLAENPHLWQERTGAPCLITPHMGEMSRLTRLSVADIKAHAESVVRDFANEHGVICLLKDAHTLVAAPHSDRLYRNGTACSGLATGGSGDVLAGILGALCAAGDDPFAAATLGVYLHSLAGLAASERLTEYAVTARDILDAIPQAIRQIIK